ncbi:hypothetical protein OG756_33350 [Streptomyces sp. NBC_01310]|uniref:hypothetical protein n=1 Tax=unclassified Streptomyces TaxID=2593676 RepID=UPI002DD8364D|nr:hypothetical protein [Streptomyces sp. NBC_01294]WRZ55814.1 hypothetical protein OG534_04565 [Streptomyces sp. NBC_01294]WSJ62458.1 hypothetical protein OG756_33350 [Streptomyces sp. NBC_01310]
MLGDLLGDEQGQTTGMRVLHTDDGLHPAMEVSFQATGTLMSAAVTDRGTYESVMRPDGSLYGEGQGIIMTREGDTVTWRGQGVGHFDDSGGVHWRGSIFYETGAPRFAELAGTAGVFEFDTDESGKMASKVYQWN